MVRRAPFVLVGVALLALLGLEQGFERWFAHKMVDAPNAGAPPAALRPGEQRIHVGPPAAVLSIEIVILEGQNHEDLAGTRACGRSRSTSSRACSLSDYR